MSSETPFDMSLVMSMIDDLYELEEQDLVGEYCTAEMMRRQGNKLLGGLDEIKTSLMTPPRLAASQTDKIMMENKVYDLNRVIEMLADLMKVDECDVREREMEMFSVAKKEAKLVLDSLKELNATLWSGTTQQDKKKEPKRKDSVDIGFNLEDVLSMIEALGQSSEDDVDDEVMLSAKEMKKRSSVMLQRLPSVSGKLDDFLKTTVSDTSIAGVIRTVEDHVGVLKRVIGVLEAVQSSPDDEVDFAVYQHYGAFQDIQREARDVLESIYSIQFGEDVSTSLQSSSKPQRKEAKRSGSKGSKSNDDDDDNAMDYPSAKDSDSDYKASPQGNNMFAHNTTTQLGSFDLSMVMSMLIDLGEDESADNTQNVENEVDLIHRQSSALVSGLQQVYGDLSIRAASSVEQQLEEESNPDAKYGTRRSDSSELEDTLCDLKRVMDLLEQLIHCDDIDEAHELMSLKSNNSFTEVKNEVKGLLSRVASMGNLPKNNHDSMTAADSKYDDYQNSNKSRSGKEGK